MAVDRGKQPTRPAPPSPLRRPHWGQRKSGAMLAEGGFMNRIAISPEDLSHAVLQAILVWCWSEEIPVSRPIREEWFRKFAARWGVARNIYRKQFGRAVGVLNKNLRSVRQGQEGETVQRIAREFQTRGIARGRPVSLVSKVAYFLYPERFAPVDRLAREGLNRRRGSRSRQVRAAEYCAYLKAFEEEFHRLERDIEGECRRSWPHDLVKRLGHTPGLLDARGFRRKVLDNLLMTAGGHRDWERRAKPKTAAAEA